MILLSFSAILTLVPIIVIIILIGAAAGLSRGMNFFSFFGLSSLLGFSQGSRGAGKGFRSLGNIKTGASAGALKEARKRTAKGVPKYFKERKKTKQKLAGRMFEMAQNYSAASNKASVLTKTPLIKGKTAGALGGAAAAAPAGISASGFVLMSIGGATFGRLEKKERQENQVSSKLSTLTSEKSRLEEERQKIINKISEKKAAKSEKAKSKKTIFHLAGFDY
ncbi:MAG: hypothetical protein M1331_02650, partial [Candidatus Marsarchaeota archaeon]|nr:hypothetical protein [Candidatus Marsarchaeota archaeon]